MLRFLATSDRAMIWMTMNLKKDFILTSFNHRLFASPAFCGLFLINGSPFGELSYYTRKNILDMAMNNEIAVFHKQLRILQNEKEELQEENEKLKKALERKNRELLRNL